MLKVFPRVTNQPLADSFPFLLLFGSFTFVIVLNSLKLKAFKPGLLFGIFRVLHTVRSLIFKVRFVVDFLSGNSLILSYLFEFVNNFFIFLFRCLYFGKSSPHLSRWN